ncbi:MAG TPA: tetratricopeptide repeat protein [Methylomirabilota bacterium]|nr:tetratricopeptide repeat protein [Methylomirabilota bacterium]
MFGRTERLFWRGQRALSRRELVTAETLLRAAVARAPHDAHLHLYLAHALAEQDRLTEAEQALAQAVELTPSAFVVHLHHAIILLDARDAERARTAVTAASALAPGNRLVEGYAELVAWAERGGAPSRRLIELTGELPESFGARALLHLAQLTLETRGPHAMLAVLEPPREPPGLPLGLWLAALRYRDRVRYAEELVERRRFGEAVDFMMAEPALMGDARAPSLLERARRGALRALEGTGTRMQLLQRYQLENDLGQEDAARGTLVSWRELYQLAGAPRAERATAAAVLRRLAELEVGRGRYTEALALCAASRGLRAERDTAGVEALALLGLGDRRAARHALSAFLKDALFRVDMRLAGATAASPA